MKKKIQNNQEQAGDASLYTLEVFITSGPITEKFAEKNRVVSRTIQIRGDQTLEQLHAAIFAAFDRGDEHMYEFQIGGKGPMDPEARCYVLPLSMEDQFSDRKPAGDVISTSIGSLGLAADDVFGYWFDFGDDWWHQINVVSIAENEPGGEFPRVTKRVGGSPPQYVDLDDDEEEGEEGEDEESAKEGKRTKSLEVADPTIDQVFEDFLEEQRKRLKPRTVRQYEDVIGLLRHHLNGYGYEGLLEEEEAFFNRYYEARGEKHREFCQLFGPDKIVENLEMFLGYFMIRKVMGSAELMAAAGRVTKKLSKWLAAKGYISDEESEEGIEEGAEAAKSLPRAEKAAEILFESADRFLIDLDDLGEDDYLDFDHFTIARIEPGRLWVFSLGISGKPELLGPIVVPESATELLGERWEISCSLGRVGSEWRILEVANVYPA